MKWPPKKLITSPCHEGRNKVLGYLDARLTQSQPSAFMLGSLT